MAEMNFKQITDKLNEEFSGLQRKLVFWYDEKGEFQEDVDGLELQNAKVLHLKKDNQVYVKHFLEREDTSTNYLVYAPFPKPEIRENHLADTIRYSKEFFADRTSLLCLDLGIHERFKPVIQKYVSFFNSKVRTKAFYDLEIERYNADTIEFAMMSILCQNRTVSFDEILRGILTDQEYEHNPYLAEFAKYGLDEAFWRHCEQSLGYADAEPTLEKLVMTTFATAAEKAIHGPVPKSWQPFLSYKPGNVVTFMDNLRNNVMYGSRYDELAETVSGKLKVREVFDRLGPEALTDCAVFPEADRVLIRWMRERLVAEDLDTRLNGLSVPELCARRKKLHFGSQFFNEYSVLEQAYHLITPGLYHPKSGVAGVAKAYLDKDYRVDQWYREFYFYYDQLEDSSPFEQLRDLVENLYTNAFLNRITVNWSSAFAEDEGRTGLDHQLDFYSKFVKYRKERVVVIISDAMRYEVGQELFDKLIQDERCDAKLYAMQSILPSITSCGMAALLPHKEITIGDDYSVLCDGQPCATLKQREAILQREKPNSRCVQFDQLKNAKQAEMREILTGMDVVYVYHNQIDARGDKLSTENEVFVACREAVDEIRKLIRDVNSKGNTYHFIITADHGFIYKRDALQESDKIGGVSNCGKRHAISASQVNREAVVSVPMSSYMQKADTRWFSSPMGADVFKAAGSGMNYVHGGCSPQEMIIPVIDVHTEKAKVETTSATVDLVSLLNKVTNLSVNLDFIQKEPVSDTVKAAQYRILFVDGNNSRISNEHIYHADKTDAEATKRVFRLRFTFKNQSYNKNDKYYLIAVDDRTGMEVFRRDVVMDLAFAGDYGFGF